MPEEAGYGRLLKDSRFVAFLGAQFFAAIVFAAAAVFTAIAPLTAVLFLLFTVCSGYLADRFSKTRVLQAAMVLLCLAVLTSGRMGAALAGFIAPAAWGILPELLPETQLVRANSLLQLTTLAAIAIGFSWRTELPLWPVALAAALASAGIAKVPAAQPARQIRKLLALPVCGILWFWIVATFFLHTGANLPAMAAGFGFGSIVAGVLSGGYIELALIPLGLALIGIFSIVPHAIPGMIAIGCGAGLFLVPLNAYLQREAPAGQRGRILALSNVMNALAAGLTLFLTGILLDRARLNAGVSVTLVGAASLLAAIVFTIRTPETVVRFILWCIARSLFRIRLEGSENIPRTGGALLVSNHISYADAVLVGCTTRLRTVHFLMWQPIFDAPVANYFFRVLQAIPIDAASPKGTVRALRAAREQLEHGELVGIFPEGSISRTGQIERFERGFKKILQGTGAPVIPIHIDGLYGHPFSCKGGSAFHSWEKVWRPVVTVRVGQPLTGTLGGTELRDAVVALSTR